MPDVLKISYRNKLFIISNRHTYCKFISYIINLYYRVPTNRTFIGSASAYIYIFKMVLSRRQIPKNCFHPNDRACVGGFVGTRDFRAAIALMKHTGKIDKRVK